MDGGQGGGHLERDETWRTVEIRMERCDVEIVWTGGGETSEKFGGLK